MSIVEWNVCNIQTDFVSSIERTTREEGIFSFHVNINPYNAEILLILLVSLSLLEHEFLLDWTSFVNYRHSDVKLFSDHLSLLMIEKLKISFLLLLFEINKCVRITFDKYHDHERKQQQQQALRKDFRYFFVFIFLGFFVFIFELISRTISANVSLTLIDNFADVSI